MPLRLKVSGLTDVGLVRPGNEDFLHIDRTNHVYAVCDGMGGHNAGEVASSTAAETIRSAFALFADELAADPDLELSESLPRNGELLVKSIRLANRAIYKKAAGDPALQGMGTTIVACAVDGDLMAVAHVGDSRAYRLDDDRLVPLTADHSLVEEIRRRDDITEEQARNFAGKNVITRALGVHKAVEVDCRLIRIKPGDTFIMCSDGLCGFATDDEIFRAAKATRKNTDQMVSDLIQLANGHGGQDNVTVLVVEVMDVEPASHDEMEVVTFESEEPELLAAQDKWLQRMLAATTESDTPDPSPEGGSNRLLIGIIFAAFLLVAVLIVWLTGQS